MKHNPEQRAAAYLSTMRPRARRDFEAHLLACEACWQEVSLARRGRALAESVREVPPAGLRDDIRAAIADTAAREQPIGAPRRWRGVAVAATAAACALAFTVVVLRPEHRPPTQPNTAPPSAVAAVIASYRSERLPGTTVPTEQAPDLARLNLRLVAGAKGRLDGLAITMFVYRTPTGARLTMYRSEVPFPEVPEAREGGGSSPAGWTLQSSEVTILCTHNNPAVLLLGSDPTLVQQAGAVLNHA